jgi:hypothetical protein
MNIVGKFVAYYKEVLIKGGYEFPRFCDTSYYIVFNHFVIYGMDKASKSVSFIGDGDGTYWDYYH